MMKDNRIANVTVRVHCTMPGAGMELKCWPSQNVNFSFRQPRTLTETPVENFFKSFVVKLSLHHAKGIRL